MEFKRAVRLYGVPMKTMRLLEKKGFISEPLSLEDRGKLDVMGFCWKHDACLRAQLLTKSKVHRARLCSTADLSKIETHAFSQFFNHYLQFMPGGKKEGKGEENWLPVEMVVQRISNMFKVRNDNHLVEMVKKMKEKAKYELTAKNGYYNLIVNQPSKVERIHRYLTQHLELV